MEKWFKFAHNYKSKYCSRHDFIKSGPLNLTCWQEQNLTLPSAVVTHSSDDSDVLWFGRRCFSARRSCKKWLFVLLWPSWQLVPVELSRPAELLLGGRVFFFVSSWHVKLVCVENPRKSALPEKLKPAHLAKTSWPQSPRMWVTFFPPSFWCLMRTNSRKGPDFVPAWVSVLLRVCGLSAKTSGCS